MGQLLNDNLIESRTSPLEFLPKNFSASDNVLYHLEMESLIEVLESELSFGKTFSNPNDFILKRSTYLKSIDGTLSDYYYLTKNRYKNIESLYLTHWFYFYRGKFHPQMIRSILNILKCKPGDKVLDPFAGSGTAGLESVLLGLDFTGIDISPLCKLISDVKTNSFQIVKEVEDAAKKVMDSLEDVSFQRSTEFYSKIQDLKCSKSCKDFFTLARISSLKNSSKSKIPSWNYFVRHLDEMINCLKFSNVIFDSLNLHLGTANFKTGDSRELELMDDTIDAIVTSPPYFCALDYINNERLSYEDLGFNADSLESNLVGTRDKSESSFNAYSEDLFNSFLQMHRVLKCDSFAVIIIGNNSYFGRKFNNVKLTINLMTEVGFRLHSNIPKEIVGKNNLLLRENILFFKK